jgi:putative AbiEii toxin of type IV toxin-antitoxin system
MITTFDIQHFKSVKNIHLDCRRINLFIGEPNTGKSNILEALGFLSWCAYGGELRDYVRLDKTQDLFYDGLVEKHAWNLNFKSDLNSISDMADTIAGNPRKPEVAVSADYEGGTYRFSIGQSLLGKHQFASLDPTARPQQTVPQRDLGFIKFYRFKSLKNASYGGVGSLQPPDGRNIVPLLFSSKELRQLAAEFFNPYKLKLVIKPHEGQLEVQKESDGIVVSFPYHLSSDTLQRILFYTIAIESNKDFTLVFEEPEAHAFPYFTKHLGERIALDENKNQYFIATHNPYLLSAVVEKAPANEVAVFVTYYRDYETRVKLLDKDALSRLFEADPFLGIEQFIEEGA